MTDVPDQNTQAVAGGRARWGWHPLPRGAPAEPVARAWLADQIGAAAGPLSLQRDARGRPRLLAPMQAWDANWSHSGGHLLVACGRDVDVGVDVEWTGRRRPHALDIAGRYFHPDEAAWLLALPDPARADAFLRLWCAKEAILKAVGVGLSFGLERVQFDADLHLHACDAGLGTPAQWHVETFVPADGFVAAVAWRMRQP